MKTCAIISIDHINQLIPALAAFRQEQAHATGIKKQLLILTKPHIAFDSKKAAHIQALINQEPHSILILGHTLFKNSKFMSRLPVRLRVTSLRKALKNYCVSEIYFSHDISSDFWNQVIMHAFPKALRICYGDALGIVYTQSYFTQLMYGLTYQNKIVMYNILARIKRYFLYPGKKNQLQANKAILAIPCDPGNDFLSNCNLSILKKEELQRCVHDLASALPEFKNHMQEVFNTNSQNCYLLMLSNFTESRLTTLDNEIALYQEILATHASKDNIVILKPHPAQHSDFLKKIVATLSLDYNILLIGEEFYHLPIELAETLVKNCTLLSVSYSSISLPYIYDKPVSHVLTQELINRYFSCEKMHWFTQSNDLYLNLINAQKSWNQDHELSI